MHRADDALSRSRRRAFPLFVAPALALYGLLFLIPSIATVWISFQKWNGVGAMQFVGMRNYRILLIDPVFRQSFINTLKIMFGVGIVTFLLAFAVTIALRQMAGRRFARAVLFFPNILSGVAVAILWGFLFQPNGLVDQALLSAGIPPPAWLNESTLFLVISAALVWIATGFYSTILMAAMDGIPPYLYEEAELVGANPLQVFWHITLPLIGDTVAVASIIWTVTSVKIFELILAFAGGAGYLPSTKVWNTALYSYAEAFAATGEPRYGTAAASAFITLLLAGLLVAIIARLRRREALEL